MIRYLHALQSNHPDKSSTHLTPYIIITILLTVFPMLTLHSCDHFSNCQFLLTVFLEAIEIILLIYIFMKH